MNLKERPIAKTKLIGGRLCLDFANTVGGRVAQPGKKNHPQPLMISGERLNDYFDLLAWGWHVKLLDERELQNLIREAKRDENAVIKVWERAQRLREAIHRICRAFIYRQDSSKRDLKILNEELQRARDHEIVVALEGRFEWHWIDRKNALDCLLWPLARSAAELLTTGDMSRLRECRGVACHWLFEDLSRNRSRHWCSMQDCGNLTKVHRFRARLRKGARKQQNA